MNTVETTFRRNLIVVSVLHGLFITGIVVMEGVIATRQRTVPSVVDLITPADILGDLPVGPGHGRGAYSPPNEPAGSDTAPGPSETVFTPEERPVPTKPKATPAVPTDPGEIKIPKKAAPAKTVKQPVKPAVTGTKTAGKPTGVAGASASDIKQRFRNALAGGGNTGGTPYGDNKTPGGGTGESKYGRPGSPDGAVDGVPGGIGKGSPFWSYYLRVRDRMYEAWEQPGQASSFDKRLMTGVLVRVARDGKVLDVSLQGSSGNKLMDDTALMAARKVDRLDPLPEGLGGATAELTVFFKLEG